MRNSDKRQPRVCVVGAGPAGLAMARALKEAGLSFDIYERNAGVGGIWDIQNPGSPMYESAHFISSKGSSMSTFSGFPFPDDTPEYPSHRQVLDYLERFALEIDVLDRIRFGSGIRSAMPRDDGRWEITTEEGESAVYEALVCCSGTLWDPILPDFEGSFKGMLRHSSTYRSANELFGKRVVIVGGGNSAVDIASDAARVAERAYLSMRRGYWFFPKFIMGFPTDIVLRGGESLPEWLSPPSVDALLELVAGQPERFGLQKPDHSPLASHPIMNSEILHHVGHGRILPRREIAHLDGHHVVFADGKREQVDEIICATGYRASIPYLNAQVLDYRGGTRPVFYLTTFHRSLPGLYAVGMLETNSGVFGLFEKLAGLVAHHIASSGHESTPHARLDEMIRTDHPDLSAGQQKIESPRHVGYVDSVALSNYVDGLSDEFNQCQ